MGGLGGKAGGRGTAVLEVVWFSRVSVVVAVDDVLMTAAPTLLLVSLDSLLFPSLLS